MTEFVALRTKAYAYQIDDYDDYDNSRVKKAKGTKKFVIKTVLKLNDYKNCLLNDKVVLKSQQRFKSERHDVYTEEVNKIALSSIDDKRLQTFDKITTYTYGTSARRVCKTELSSKVNIKLLILMSILMKVKYSIIKSDLTFQITHTEYLL